VDEALLVHKIAESNLWIFFLALASITNCFGDGEIELSNRSCRESDKLPVRRQIFLWACKSTAVLEKKKMLDQWGGNISRKLTGGWDQPHRPVPPATATTATKSAFVVFAFISHSVTDWQLHTRTAGRRLSCVYITISRWVTVRCKTELIIPHRQILCSNYTGWRGGPKKTAVPVQLRITDSAAALCCRASQK